MLKSARKLCVVMGVSGSGKSTVAEKLSMNTGWPWLEADDFHSVQNKDKMSKGRPLTDADRAPWVAAILSSIEHREDDIVILACSALTPFVQEQLSLHASRQVVWCLLDGSAETIRKRMEARNHFMPPALLDSQLAALSTPKGAYKFSIEAHPEAIAENIKTMIANL